MKLTNSGGRVNQRRIDVKKRLEKQLKDGTKPVQSTKNEFVKFGTTEPLTEVDIKRIEKEISILESRIYSDDVANARRTKKYRGGGR